MIKPVATVNVVPNLPERLSRLEELAYNLRWAWDADTIELFRRLDGDLWTKTYHNPVMMLGLISQERLDAAQNDPSFMAHMTRVLDSYDRYMRAENTWYKAHYGHLKEQPTIAYFSMEFGITEALQNYSGGLGVLSGDHLKSASDLGLPLIGVGLLYQEGYFQQYLNADGYQQESYPINDYSRLPVTLQRDADGKPIKISVAMPGRQLYAQVWKVQVGRVPLYLLDTNIPENPLPEDRDLTDQLYGGDRRTRIRQEIVMGIGGIRALELLNLRPTICHMNEGHSAFLGLERIRQMMTEKGYTFDQALQISKNSNIFTTHTPVPAGLERFGFDLINEHFTDYTRELGLTIEQFIDLGREKIENYELFSMAVLALKLSSGSNGVAQLHGEVSRRMWQWLYPRVPREEIPIKAVTNGVHMQSWVSAEIAMLFDRYLDPAWRTDEERPEIWQGVDAIPDNELWRAHDRRRQRLITFARERLTEQLQRRGLSPVAIAHAEEVLDPDTLTIGFARRFATYKRATLFLKDVERLNRIVNNTERPVQFIFAGKAHPHDEGGKALIREIVKISNDPTFRDRIVFLENYDMQVARYMVQGVDVWLNNPRRPKEASGTSGMKVIYNGGLNCSILDGWWAEAYDPQVGWAIGNGEEYPESEAEHQDFVESEALYNVLEQEIIPTFYNRGRDDVPREWLSMIKASMKKLAPFFNTRRMVQEYTDLYYMPTVELVTALGSDSPLEYAKWRSHLNTAWAQIKVKDVQVEQTHVKVGGEVNVTATVELGDFTPEDVQVHLYFGQLDPHGEIGDQGEYVLMQPVNGQKGSIITFKGTIAYTTSGNRGVSVRVLPNHPYLTTPFQPGLITWA
ncbi:MAG: glycosyltransferase family 1 protein [Anaerolineae bacterium]